MLWQRGPWITRSRSFVFKVRKWSAFKFLIQIQGGSYASQPDHSQLWIGFKYLEKKTDHTGYGQIKKIMKYLFSLPVWVKYGAGVKTPSQDDFCENTVLTAGSWVRVGMSLPDSVEVSVHRVWCVSIWASFYIPREAFSKDAMSSGMVPSPPKRKYFQLILL